MYIWRIWNIITWWLIPLYLSTFSVWLHADLLHNLFLYTWVEDTSGSQDLPQHKELEPGILVHLELDSVLGNKMKNKIPVKTVSKSNWTKQFLRKRFFRNQPTRNKNCLWQPCLLTDRDEINILYRRPSIDASYQVSDQLAKQFQGRRFLEIDQSETRIACGSHVC